MNSLRRYDELINIGDTFRQAFGINPPPEYKIPPKEFKPTPEGKGDYKIDAAPVEPRYINGTPLYGTDIHKREFYLPVNLGGVDLFFPVISVRQRKSIVKTPMVERKGSVNEIINTDDVEIVIRGIIVRPDNFFPAEEMNQLNDLFNRNESLSIFNAITDIVLKNDDGSDASKVIITSLEFPPVVGKKGQKPYEIICTSDLIFRLEIV